MTATKFALQALGRGLLSLLLVGTTVVHAQTPAQVPLLTKPAAAVAPNVMLTIDDSGSMSFRHMPENVFAGGTYATPNPVASRTVIWDKNDNFQTATTLIGTVPGNAASTNYRLRALRSPDTNTVYYSPEIWYQPWITADGVTRMPNSPVTTAYLTPPILATTATSATSMLVSIASKTFTLAQTGKAFVVGDSVVISSTAAPTTQWMFGNVTAFNAGTGAITVNVTRTAGAGTLASWNVVRGNFVDLTAVSPMGSYAANTLVAGRTYTILTVGSTNFTLIGAATNTVGTVFRATGAGIGSGTAGGALTGWCFANATNADCATATANFVHDPGVYFRLTKTGSVYNNVTVDTNYTAFTINAPVSTTFTKYPARLDCLGAVCTLAEERQNFANWYSYYRNRNLLARGGLMEAFAVESTPVTAGNFVIGSSYTITSVGTTLFTTIGASANTVDTVFTATGVGSGTGTARAVAMRLGFGRINQGTSAAVDGVNTTVLENNPAYGGGGVRDFNRARKNNLYQWLENAPASGGTPLVGALQANGVYYSRTDNRSPWTDNPAVNTNVVANNKTCRRSYTFLTTDGYWTTAGSAGNSDNTAGATITSAGSPVPNPPLPYTYTPVAPYRDTWSNTLADTAMQFWKTDLQPATVNAVAPITNNPSFWQNMTTFTVGLGVRGSLDPDVDLPALTAGTKTWPQAFAGGTDANVDDLWHAAVNSRGQYFSVNDPQELATAIRTALASATAVTGSTAGVATASTTLTGSNRKYKLEFDPGNWNGEITALGPNITTGVLDTPVWTASSKMPAFSARNIVTFDNSPGIWAGIPFNWASIPLAGQAEMGPVAALNPTAFINFLKGDHSNEGTGGLYRTRLNPQGAPFILGDFVNANPALIRSNFDGVYTDPAFGGVDINGIHAYTHFKAFKAGRTPVLFAGSNDGMLHAFRDSLGVTPATDGQEIFAYVPRTVYGNLDKLADKNYGVTAALSHQYFVDGPLAEADAYVNAPGAASPSWRNYLMGTLGAGGRAVFALDVTDTANLNASSVRWELSSADDPDIGYVLSNVRIGVLPNGRWVAVFGNGHGSTSGRAVLFVVDLEDAASNNAATRASAVHKTVVDTTGSNGLGGVTLIHDSVTGRITTIYAGDLKGKLWKLIYNSPNGVPVPGSPWFDADGGTAFFTATDTAGVAQPISSSPAVFKGPNTNGWLVVFGTGKLFSTADASDASPQTVYSVWDKKAGTNPLPETVPRPMSRSDLLARTLTQFAGTGAAAGTTFYSISGAAVDYNSPTRGWYIDLNATIPGGRVIYPSQVTGYNTALLSAVAPVQGNPVACVPGSGTGLNMLLQVDTGTSSTTRTFDTNGDGVINSSDAVAGAYGTKADGGDVSVSSQGPNGNPRADTGGGGPVGDCTGDACAKTKCVQSSICGVGKCLVVIESASGSLNTCPPDPEYSTRIWRRIINPPIR